MHGHFQVTVSQALPDGKTDEATCPEAGGVRTSATPGQGQDRQKTGTRTP